MSTIIVRSRDTSFTRIYIANTLKLVSELQIRDMTSAEIGRLLGYATASISKYTRELKKLGIVKQELISTDTKSTREGVLYRITADTARVRWFLKVNTPAHMAVPVLRPEQEPLGKIKVMRVLDGTKHFPRRATKIVVQRPALVEALFGPAKTK